MTHGTVVDTTQIKWHEQYIFLSSAQSKKSCPRVWREKDKATAWEGRNLTKQMG